MNTAFRESFDADLSAITNPALLRRIRKVIEQVEAAQTFEQIGKTVTSIGTVWKQCFCATKALGENLRRRKLVLTCNS